MKAMLLAAGRSTRLGALGERLPKPLVPICGYPAIRFGCAAIAEAGIREVVVNLHHHGEAIRAALGDGRDLGLEITYSDEPDLLGTGGGVARARDLLGDGPVLVMNAKVVADVDLRALLAAHAASGADATLVLRDDADASGWGAIAADATGRIVSILGAPAAPSGGGVVVERMFTGIQVIGPRLRERLRPVFSDTVRDGYIPALSAGADLRAFVTTGYFAEHSTPERYLRGNVALLREPSLVARPPGPLTGVDARARIDPSAVIVSPVRIGADVVVEADAVVGPDVVLCAGAHVPRGVRIARAVAWPMVSVTADCADAVVTADGIVAVRADTPPPR